MSQEQVGYTGPRPGDRITTREQLDALPPGSVVTRVRDGSQRYQKGGWDGLFTPDTEWINLCNVAPYTAKMLAAEANNRRYEVESVSVDMGETVAQYAARFRDIAITGSERAFGGPESAVRVLDRMEGVAFRPSVGLRIVNKYDRSRLPNGTVVTAGDPDDYDRFVVAVKDGVSWRTLFGKGMSAANTVAVTIDSLPDTTEPADWFTEQATPEDRDRVLQFKLTAWNAGHAEKVQRRWCSEFERVMIRAGLSDHLLLLPFLNGHRIGDEVTPEQAAELGVGVILSTPVTNGREAEVGVFERVEKSRNRAGTRLVGGVNYTHHFAHRMVIRGVPGPGTSTGLGIRVLSVEFMDAVPVGTVVGSGIGNAFIKVERENDTRREWVGLHGYNTPAEAPQHRRPQYRADAFHPGPRSSFFFFRFGPYRGDKS